MAKSQYSGGFYNKVTKFKRPSRLGSTKRGSLVQDGYKYNQAVNKMSNNFMTLVDSDDKNYDKLS